MKCEACGGDGLIETGAYRGDESDTTTRECRLCGGVVTGDVIAEACNSAASASASFRKLAHTTSESGVRVRDLVIATAVSASGNAQAWAKKVAAKEDERLRRDNELQELRAASLKINRHVCHYEQTGTEGNYKRFSCACGNSDLR